FADLLGVAPERLRDCGAEVGVTLYESGSVPLVVAEHVVPDEHLAVRVRSGADPDRRNVQGVRDRARDLRGNSLEHDREAAGRLERPRLVDELPRTLGRAALRLEPAEDGGRL